MGKRIVLTSLGSFGDVNPYIGLALGLKARGHTPVIATSPFYRDYVEREGIEFHAVRPDVSPNDRETIRRVMDPRRGTEYIIREVVIRHLRESHADLDAAARGADLLVTHPITFAGPIVAGARGVPWVSTVLAPMSFFSVHDLPVFPPAPWMKRLERVPGVASLLVRMAKSVTRGWTDPVRELRAELGLPPGADPIHAGQHSPNRILALFSPLLGAPQPDWPANVEVTGAIPYNGPAAERPLSEELEAFLDAGPPPVVFTLGSSAVGAAGDFYHQSLEAVRRLGVRAVLLVGRHAENRPAGRIPDGAILVEFAPHAALFPRAAAIVHQAGAGTLDQALRAGRPTLVVPFAHDQPDNAYRVERLGVSRTLRPRRYRADRVVKELRALLEEPSYGSRAEAVAARVREEDGVAAACDALEEAIGVRAEVG